MGAFSDLTDYLNAMSNPSQMVHVPRYLANAAGAPRPTFLGVTTATGIPTTGFVPTNTIMNAYASAVQVEGTTWSPVNPASGTNWLTNLEYSSVDPATSRGTFILVDLLQLQGGLNATTTGAQTTNLPTWAINRYTDGVGVHAALVIFTAIGTTATTFTVSYTPVGGGSATSLPQTIGGTNDLGVGRLIPIPLNGHTGLTSVANVNLVDTTGTAGNFGVLLYKPLAVFTANFSAVQKQSLSLFNPESFGVPAAIKSNACLGLICSNSSTTSSFVNGVASVSER